MRVSASIAACLAAVIFVGALPAQAAGFAPIGLPAGESSYPVFSRYPGLPPLSALVPQAGAWVFLPQLAVSQGMTNGLVGVEPNLTIISFFDYENLSLGIPALVGLGKGWSLGATLKLAYLSGGFLDPAIQAFHGWFGFPNNSRDKLPQNEMHLNLDTHNSVAFHRDSPVWMLADPTLFLGFSALRLETLQLSLLTQISLPLGLGADISGSSLPGLGWGVYADWTPVWWLGVHAALGWIMPLEALGSKGPATMAQARLAAIINPGWDILPFVQFSFQTSPFTTDVYDGSRDYFAVPNSDLYFGVIIAWPEARRQGSYGAFTIQEDPFTHDAADVSFMASGAFSLAPGP